MIHNKVRGFGGTANKIVDRNTMLKSRVDEFERKEKLVHVFNEYPHIRMPDSKTLTRWSTMGTSRATY